jgi:hypothetical protein
MKESSNPQYDLSRYFEMDLITKLAMAKLNTVKLEMRNVGPSFRMGRSH